MTTWHDRMKLARLAFGITQSEAAERLLPLGIRRNQNAPGAMAGKI